MTITEEEGRGEDEHSSCDMIRGCCVCARAKIGHFLKFFIGLAEMWDAKLLTMIILMGKFRGIFLVVCFCPCTHSYNAMAIRAIIQKEVYVLL